LPWDDDLQLPLSTLQIFELWRDYEDDPVGFARAIEEEHGIEGW